MKCLQTIEQLDVMENKPPEEDVAVYMKTKPERDIIKTVILQQLEEITNKNNNTLSHLLVLRILNTILNNKWYAFELKDVWNLIYLANYLYDLNDIFKGTFIAEQSMEHAKNILMTVLDCKKGQLTNEQSIEITKMLSHEAIKNFEQVTMEFDVQSKKIRQKLESFEMQQKVEGMQELIQFFRRCRTFKDQLRLFGTKTKEVMKNCLADIVNIRNQRGTKEF